MASKTMTATFVSSLAASTAAGRLLQFGVDPGDMRLTNGELCAVVDDAYGDLVIESLRSSGASDIATTQNEPKAEDWMSHHGERSTSAGVPPGQGDSEAGVP